jgi:hypothetical protein
MTGADERRTPSRLALKTSHLQIQALKAPAFHLRHKQKPRSDSVQGNVPCRKRYIVISLASIDDISIASKLSILNEIHALGCYSLEGREGVEEAGKCLAASDTDRWTMVQSL